MLQVGREFLIGTWNIQLDERLGKIIEELFSKAKYDEQKGYPRLCNPLSQLDMFKEYGKRFLFNH